jgi:hypothetical protein
MFGGNDDHGFMTGDPEGREVGTFGSPLAGEVPPRVASVMDTVTRNGAYLVWIGLPHHARPASDARFDVINSICRPRPRSGRPASPTSTRTSSSRVENGGYAQYNRGPTAKLVKMRADDGVHFERRRGPHRREGARRARGALRLHVVAGVD